MIMDKRQKVTHRFPPVIDKESELLILGSFPSVQSRKDDFYYVHKQNRFWPLLARLFKDDTFLSLRIEDKKTALTRNHIALYDVIESCEIEGSKDSSIKNAVATDVTALIEGTQVHTIALNGKKAEALFKKHNPGLSDMSQTLPSTSPANARYDLEALLKEWKTITINHRRH